MPNGVDRTTVVAGPAIILWKSEYFYTEGDITLATKLDTDDINTALYGPYDKIITGRSVKATFTPNQFTEAGFPLLWPYFSFAPNQSLFGATDAPLVIQTVNGKKISIIAAAITKMPSLKLSTKGNIIGDVEFSGVTGKTMDWADANSLIKVENNDWADPGSFLPAKVLNQVYRASWATTGAWSSFTAKEGFNIDFALKFREEIPDAFGMIDAYFQSIDATVKCKPYPAGSTPVAENDILTSLGIQGAGSARGKSLSTLASAHDLVITGDEGAAQPTKRKLALTITKAAITDSNLLFSLDNNRNGEVSWSASRVFSGNSMLPLAAFSLT